MRFRLHSRVCVSTSDSPTRPTIRGYRFRRRLGQWVGKKLLPVHDREAQWARLPFGEVCRVLGEASEHAKRRMFQAIPLECLKQVLHPKPIW